MTNLNHVGSLFNKLGWVVSITIGLTYPILVAYVAFNYEKMKVIEKDIVELRNDGLSIRNNKISEYTGLEDRVKELEKTVIGEIQPGLEEKRRPITSAEAWQRNRDRELREQIKTLQVWRNDLEKRLQELERR